MKSTWGNRLLWLIPLVIICLAAGMFLGAKVLGSLSPPIGVESKTSNTQVINAITRTEQIALLSLGIEGIAEKSSRTSVFGVEVPGSERAMFIQYTFNAKLGLAGEDVTIQQIGENKYTVSIPDFIFIGHDDVSFRMVTENNGVLSWSTPRIDALELTNSILNDESQQQYIDTNEEILRSQTMAFYNGIIKAIDPTIELVFEFNASR